MPRSEAPAWDGPLWAATATIPIVFVNGADPIKAGLVPSLSRLAGNATGVHLLTGALDPKKLGLLRELAPHATLVGVLLNPNVAQQGERMRRVGALMPHVASNPQAQACNAAFLEELERLGWAVGRNVTIDYRWSASVGISREHKLKETYIIRFQCGVGSSAVGLALVGAREGNIKSARPERRTHSPRRARSG